MIQVERLSKRYGAIRAIESLNFTVDRGEIVGFLGPNGAGKTTTMRILTTFLTPSSGRARLAGYDVLDDPLKVRRAVGYLPESVPLYPEMRTREFLRFRVKLKEVPWRKRRAAIDRVIDRCGLQDVADRILGNLSRGYRQRVGLADALIHDPDILILDEPTAGLDPIQIREVRSLIRELGEHHTILLSTHIMPEVEAICGRVIIVAAGRIALDDSLRNLQIGRAIEIEARGPADALRRLLESAPGVLRVTHLGAIDEISSFVLQTDGGSDLRESLAHRIVQNGYGLRRLDQARSTLEERFVQAVREAISLENGSDTKTEPEAA